MKTVEEKRTFKLVGNLLAEFGAGNLVILAFNDPDMAALRRRAKTARPFGPSFPLLSTAHFERPSTGSTLTA